jgi:hypothetical protein
MSNEQNNEPWFDVERLLRDDDSGCERDALLRRLEEASFRIKREMDKGVPAQRFSQLDAVYKGLEAAARVVVVVWRRRHPA